MMGNMYVLYGKANCGKSESIKKVFDLLKSKYPSAKINMLFTGNDIKVIMTGVNGLIVGIESQGDPYSRLEQSLIDFENAGCDIIFCASRTRGMTVDWIDSHSGKYTIEWIHQKYVDAKTGRTNSNSSIAKVLIDKAGL